MTLIERWRLYQLKKIAFKQTSKPEYKGYASIKHVLIVFDYEPKLLEQIQHFANTLKHEGKVVECLSYYDGKRKDAPQKEDFQLICKDDLNWYGAPKPNLMTPFKQKEYQLFLQLAKTNQKMLPFISNQIRAAFTCGIHAGERESFDLQIDAETTDLNKIFKELDYYLHFINKAKA
jgi:hypothetical protein